MTSHGCMALTLKPKPNLQLHIVSLIHLVKKRRTHQNQTNLVIGQNQTDNPKWLVLSTYMTLVKCTNITEKKNEKIKHTQLTKLENHVIKIFFNQSSYMKNITQLLYSLRNNYVNFCSISSNKVSNS